MIDGFGVCDHQDQILRMKWAFAPPGRCIGQQSKRRVHNWALSLTLLTPPPG